MYRAQVRDVTRHVAVLGENDDFRIGKTVGQIDRGRDRLLPRTFDQRLAGESRTATAFDASGHTIEN
ncbi:MAG: hypothetical protein ACO3J2_07315, partial [Chthoniobacterales bacterium]